MWVSAIEHNIVSVEPVGSPVKAELF